MRDTASGCGTPTGTEGEIDLSHLAGRGVLAAWDYRSYFEKVHVTEHRSIAWDDQIELCPDDPLYAAYWD